VTNSGTSAPHFLGNDAHFVLAIRLQVVGDALETLDHANQEGARISAKIDSDALV
jgi:hypothetical protein